MNVYISIFITVLLTASPFSLNSEDNELDLAYEMSFEELSKVRYGTSVSLTDTPLRFSPAIVTQIGQKQIESSGARSINELLEMSVPNLQIERSVFHGEHTGLRGIMSTADDSFLYLVNGRPVSFKFLEGNRFERSLYLMHDIQGIEVVRGPASVLYGPGALWGVINVKTHTGLTFQGMDFKIQQHFIDQSSSMELRWGEKLAFDRGWFIYYGAQNHYGADNNDAPVVYGNSFTANNGQQIIAGQRSPLDEPPDHHFAKTQHKLFLDYTHGDFNAWFRMSHSGEQSVGRWHFHRTTDPGKASPTTNVDHIVNYRINSYESYVLALSYKDQISETLEANYKLSFDHQRFYNKLALPDNTYSVQPNNEHQILAQSTLSWTPNEKHSLALALELSYVHLQNEGAVQSLTGKSWDSHQTSLVFEHQYVLNEKWRMFSGLRTDKHRYSDLVYSPRWSLVYSPNKTGAYKLIVSRSVRLADEFRSRRDDMAGLDPDVETLDAIELRYDYRKQGWNWGLGAGFQVYDAVDNINVIGQGAKTGSHFAKVGRYKIFFSEFELGYRKEKWRWDFNHSLTKLIESDEKDSVDPSQISVEAKGKGDDLAHWANHISKLMISHQSTSKFSWNTSLVVYWGFPGSEDRAEYNSFERPDGPATRAFIDDESYDKAFGPNVYLNAGSQYDINKNTTVRLDFYNILGWVDIDYNKRNYRDLSDTYRSEAPAIGLSFSHKF